MPDVRPLASLLKSISFKSRATLKIDDIGLRIIVEEGRSIQAEAFLSKASFSSYHFELSLDSPSAFFEETPPPPPPNDARDLESSQESQEEEEEESTPEPTNDSEEDGRRRRKRRRKNNNRERGPPHCEIVISLSSMLECLNIFGNAGVNNNSNPFRRDDHQYEDKDDDRGGDNNRRARRVGGGGGTSEDKQTSLKLSYKGIGEPLIMLLEESGIVTRCELTTYEPEGLLDLNFTAHERVQRLIIKSEWLRDALLELPPTSEKLTISFSPAPEPPDEEEEEERQEEEEEEPVPLFRLEATGANGSTEMDYSENPDILEVFECDTPIRNSYKFSHIQLTKHALANSIKTSIRTDDYGLISFQFMIPLPSLKGIRNAAIVGGGGGQGATAFVEFKCVALDE
ncbi:hypothetical protein JCM3765_001054 [Sporobolomyces pararoseus]